MYLPALQLLRKRYPSSKISIVGPKPVKDILQNHAKGLYDKFIIVDCPWIAPFNLRYKNIFNFLFSILLVRKKKYSIALDFRGDFRNILYMSLFRSENKISFNTTGGDYMLTKAFYCPPEILHLSDEALYLLKMIEIIPGSEIETKPNLELCDADYKFIDNFLVVNNLKNTFIVGIHPGVSASSEARQWSSEKYAILLVRIYMKYPKITFVIFEGPNEELAINQISNYLKKNDVNFIRIKRPFQDYIKLLNTCNLLICNDSGAGHLAAAFSIPSVVIFGKGDPKAVMPIGKNTIKIISHELECKPCNQHFCKYGTNECIKSISVAEVFESVSEIIDSNYQLS